MESVLRRNLLLHEKLLWWRNVDFGILKFAFTPFSILWRVQRDIRTQNSGSASQANGHSCFAESNYLQHLCLVTDHVYNMKFRQNQFSKNCPDARLQTDGNDLNNKHCFRILRGESRKRPLWLIMIQNVVGIMFAVQTLIVIVTLTMFWKL